jgi:hypothetical protein
MLIYFSVAFGVVISIVLPILRQMLPKPKVEALARTKSRAEKIWEISKPYVITGVFSLLVSVVIVALLGDTINTWQKAFLAGYTADSTLQKLTSTQKS